MNIFKIPVIGQFLDLIGLDGEFGIQHTGGGCNKATDTDSPDDAQGDSTCTGPNCEQQVQDEFSDEEPPPLVPDTVANPPRFGPHEALTVPSGREAAY